MTHARAIGFAGLAAAWMILAATSAAATDETPENLPAGNGRDETFYGCIACHGTAIIKQQGMSRERWDQTIDWMVERHGMPELDQGDRALILDYLATHFPPRQRGPANPFLKQ